MTEMAGILLKKMTSIMLFMAAATRGH